MARQIILLLLLLPCMALAAPYGGMYPDAISSADIPDPLVPLDGCQGITGDLTASGTVTGGTVTDGTATLTGGNMTGLHDVVPAGYETYSCGTNASRWYDINAGHGFFTHAWLAYIRPKSATADIVNWIRNDAYNCLACRNLAGTEVASISATGVITGSALEVSQGVVYTGHQTISAATDTLVSTDHIVQVDASSNNVNITLPAVADNDGKMYIFEVSTDPGANTITLTGNAAENIDGANTYTSLDTQYQAVYLYCAGADWRVVGEAGMGSSDPLPVDHITSADTTECPILGEGAAPSLDAGADGNFIAGNQAADACTDAGFDNNVVAGTDAMGAVNGSATDNLVFGREAMFGSAATTGSRNFAGGCQSLFSLTTGDHNTGIGAETLRNLTTGHYNFAGGYTTLYKTTTGQFNVGLGRWAGYENTTACNQLFLGGWYAGAGGLQTPLDHRWEVTTLTADHHVDDFQVNRVATYELPLVCDTDGLVVDRLQVESAAGITLKPTAVAPGNPAAGVVIYFLTPDNDVISKDSGGNTVVIAAMP